MLINRQFLHRILPPAGAAIVLWLLAFRVGNTDFWWHIKAGQIMRETGWITTDPFAYSRIGEPYLASHAWLSEIIMSLIYDIGGWQGITFLRIILVMSTFGLPLLLAKRRMWIGIIPAVLSTAGARPSLTDRPQLFTFLLFSLTATVCFAYLGSSKIKRRNILFAFPVIIFLWSNLHGAASITGIALMAALFVDQLWRKSPGRARLFAALLCSVAAMLATPNGFANIGYLLSLSADQSASFIAEWQPVSIWQYLRNTSPLWAIALVSLFFGRKHLVFSGLMLGGMGYLSLSAGRHQTLFLIAALVVSAYQLRYVTIRKERLLTGICAIGMILLGGYVHMRSYDINRADHLFGFGVFKPMHGASAYIQKEEISGNMFNNYNAGGELLFHGHSVFLDGRNIDYGYDYIVRAVNAGVEPSIWKPMEEEFAFTHAVIYYDLQAELDPLPYTDLLDAAPDWQLVYLDDWAAVYARDGASKYEGMVTVTPKSVHRQDIPQEMGLSEFRAMESELKEMIQRRPDGVKARVYLAKLYTALNGYDEARDLLHEALAVQPKNFTVHAGLLNLAMERGDWQDALRYLKSATRAAGFSGVQINTELAKEIRRRAVTQ